MSKPADNGGSPEAQAWEALDHAVTRALEHLETLEDRLAASEAQSAELVEVVRRFTGDETEAGRILTRLQSLEDENGDLRRRLDEGRQGVDRMLAQIRFLENQE